MKNYDLLAASNQSIDADVLSMLSALNEAKGTFKVSQSMYPEKLKRLLVFAKVQSAASSNRIEGNEITDDKVLQLEKKQDPQTRPEAEVLGYLKALSYIHQRHEGLAITPKTILLLHKMIYEATSFPGAGIYKTKDNMITETDDQGHTSVRFMPVEAAQTPMAVAELCSAYDDAIRKGKSDPLLLSALFVLDFLCIHPFDDGNGRLSRLLMLLLLYRAGHTVGQYISLERLIEQNKEEYYRTLYVSSEKWHDNANDPGPFVSYYLSMLRLAYNQFESRLSSLSENKKKTDQIEAVFDDVDWPLTKQELLARFPGTSESTVEATLSRLLKNGKISKLGGGRYTKYQRKLG